MEEKDPTADLDALAKQREKFNAAINAWAQETASDAQSQVTAKGIKDWSDKWRRKYSNYKPVTDHVHARTKKDAGEIYAIGIGFPSQGIFTLLGVGRGISFGSGSAIAATLTGKARIAKDFISPALDPRMNLLADIVGEHKADEQVIRLLKFDGAEMFSRSPGA